MDTHTHIYIIIYVFIFFLFFLIYFFSAVSDVGVKCLYLSKHIITHIRDEAHRGSQLHTNTAMLLKGIVSTLMIILQ